MKIRNLAVAVAALAVMLAGAAVASPRAAAQQELPDAVEQAVRADAAFRADVSESNVSIVQWQAVTWANACLEARRPGEFCAEVQTPGFQVWARAGGDLFRYHTNEDASALRLAVHIRGERDDNGDGDGNGDGQQPVTQQYVVQSGDTLARIAARFGTTVQAIAQANNIANVNLIFVGQVLNIPVAGDGDDDGDGEQPVTQQYVVQSGDTLFRIAQRFGTTVEAIVQANNIANPNLIFVGQVLNIPGAGDGDGDGDGEQPVTQQYVVQSGDTLFRIAQRFGTSVQALVQANNIANPNLIFVGQVLNIPS